MSFPSWTAYQEKIQAHVAQHQTTYALVGTYTLTAYAVHSKWGTVAVVIGTASVAGVYTYVRPKLDTVSRWAVESRFSALFPVITSVVAVVFPWLGVWLGMLTGGAHWWKDRQVQGDVEQAKSQVKQLTIDNGRLANIVTELELKLKELEALMNKNLAMAAEAEKVAVEHTETQQIVKDVEEQMDQLQTKVDAMLVAPPPIPFNLGERMDHIGRQMEANQQRITQSHTALQLLLAQAKSQLAAYGHP